MWRWEYMRTAGAALAASAESVASAALNRTFFVFYDWLKARSSRYAFSADVHVHQYEDSKTVSQVFNQVASRARDMLLQSPSQVQTRRLALLLRVHLVSLKVLQVFWLSVKRLLTWAMVLQGYAYTACESFNMAAYDMIGSVTSSTYP